MLEICNVIMWTDSPDAITKCRFFSKEFVRRVNLYTDRLLSTKDKLCRKNTDLLMLKQTLCSVTIVIQRVNDAFVTPRHYHRPITGYHSLLHLSGDLKLLASYPDRSPGVLTEKFVIS